ncbi:MAG: hypothetical protein ABIH34_01560 [Nanoarchaeota archaeon]
MRNAKTCVSSANLIVNSIKKNDPEWMSGYIGNYDALRMLSEALLLFDRVEVSNQVCLFAFLCSSHDELNLSWKFLEEVRMKRNGIQDYGKTITYEDWNNIEAQMRMNISTLQVEIQKRLEEKNNTPDEA